VGAYFGATALCPQNRCPHSDLAIRRAKPTGKTQKLFDGGGLYLEISPAGGRWWRMKYRFGGKEKRLALGVYPEVTLALARNRREDARRLLAQGTDPGQQKKDAAAAKAGLDALTFESIGREWMKGRIWAPSYRIKVEAWMENDVFPWIGSRQAAELEAPDFLSIARRMERRGAIESGHRVIQNCGQIMRYAIASGIAKRNPVADLRGALQPKPKRHYAALAEPKELAPLLRAIYAYQGRPVTRWALALAPLVFVRPGELRQAAWSEFDLDAGVWVIPAGRMKMRAEHMVPLSRQALAILREIRPLTYREPAAGSMATAASRYVFSGRNSAHRPLSENTVNTALRRMGFESDQMTGHGFRAIARTILDEVLGFRPDIIEHQLAHAVKDPNGRAYNRTTHLVERTRMMQEWADYLDRLRLGDPLKIAA
jgi:integrase